MRTTAAIGLALATLAAHAPVHAQQFNAKTVTLMVGFPPGGGYDAVARVFVRHYGKHLPGNPNVIVQNQPGAGSMVATNRLYNAAPKDGSQLAMFAAAVAIEPLIGNERAKYDITRFEWIGNLNRDTSSCGVWHTAGVRNWAEAAGKKLKIAAAGVGAIQQARFMVAELGAPFDIISGFRGTGPIHLALQRGEVDGACGIFTTTARGLYRDDMESGRFTIFLQFSRQPEPTFKGATTVYSLAKTEDDRKLAALIFGPAEISRPVAAPPGTPPGIVGTLRTGLEKTARDPDYLADMRKLRLEPQLLTGEQTAAAFSDLVNVQKPLIERARKIISSPKAK